MHYSPKFKEKPIRNGGPDKKMYSNGITFTFSTNRAVYRLKSDAQEAAKSINSKTRIVKKRDGYWIMQGGSSDAEV